MHHMRRQHATQTTRPGWTAAVVAAMLLIGASILPGLHGVVGGAGHEHGCAASACGVKPKAEMAAHSHAGHSHHSDGGHHGCSSSRHAPTERVEIARAETHDSDSDQPPTRDHDEHDPGSCHLCLTYHALQQGASVTVNPAAMIDATRAMEGMRAAARERALSRAFEPGLARGPPRA